MDKENNKLFSYEDWISALDYEMSVEILAVNYSYNALKSALYDETDELSKSIRQNHCKFAIARAIEKYDLFSPQRAEMRKDMEKQTFVIKVSTIDMDPDVFETIKRELGHSNVTVGEVSKLS